MKSLWEALLFTVMIAFTVCAVSAILQVLMIAAGDNGLYEVVGQVYSCFVTVVCTGIVIWKIDSAKGK